MLAVDGGWSVSEGRIRSGTMKYALGIDIGGTNIQALAVTPSGRVLADVLTADRR